MGSQVSVLLAALAVAAPLPPPPPPLPRSADDDATPASAVVPAAAAPPPAVGVPLPVAAAPASYGSLGRPGFDPGNAVAGPLSPWVPQPGDVILSGSNRVLAVLASPFTGQPAHAGVVVRMADGRPGVAEAGGDGDFSTRVVPLCDRLGRYGASVWVRRRCAPLTEDQVCRLSEFAAAADGGYAGVRGVLSGGRLWTRGPVRTAWVGRPRGPGGRYFCGEFVVEALAYAGAVDPDAARPSAVFPQDLFSDASINPYLRAHPPLGCGWQPPARWCGAGF